MTDEPICTLTLPGTLRIKKNSKNIARFGKKIKLVPSKAYQRWEKNSRDLLAIELVQRGVGGFFPIKTELHIQTLIYYKGPRMDLSGALESVGDCLEGIIWENDRQICSWDGSRLHHDLENPRTVIFIRNFKG